MGIAMTLRSSLPLLGCLIGVLRGPNVGGQQAEPAEAGRTRIVFCIEQSPFARSLVATRNDQGEFNLHNDPVLETAFDQLPRTILTLAAPVGGVIAPLVRRRGGTGERDFHSAGPSGWMWPTLASFPAAFCAVTVKLPEHVFAARDRPLPYLIDIVPGETKELCLALFLFVHALGMQRALASEDSSPCGSESGQDHLCRAGASTPARRSAGNLAPPQGS